MSDARQLTQSLGGTWRGRYGVAPCPVCQPERRRDQRGLSIGERGGDLLVHCFKTGCDFLAVLRAAGAKRALEASPWSVMSRGAWQEANPCPETVARRAQQAREVWLEATPIIGSLAEVYLRRRGITCELPTTLRFHQTCWHSSARRLPAMVALVEGVSSFAIHRTYLRPDGTGKAEADPTRAMLGQVSGGAVRLAQAAEALPASLVVAEGIETALSLASGLLNGPIDVWAALSAGGLAGLRLPAASRSLIIASDGDEPGRDAARRLAERAWTAGWRVSLFAAPDGLDWNNVLSPATAKVGAE